MTWWNEWNIELKVGLVLLTGLKEVESKKIERGEWSLLGVWMKWKI